MPINVICTGCHSRFTVPDKYAGKSPPCPKCKTIINVPKLDQQVKVHESATEPGAKDAKGRPVLKPVSRTDAKFNPVVAVAVGVLTIMAFLGAFVLRSSVREAAEADAKARVEKEGSPWPTKQADRDKLIANARQTPFIPAILGLAVLSPMLVWAGYQFLRDAEKEALTGVSLYVRVIACAAAYIGLWGIVWALYQFGPFTVPDDRPETWAWLYMGLPFIGAGGAIAWAALDLDWGDAYMHYCFYLITTILLRVTMGVGMV